MMSELLIVQQSKNTDKRACRIHPLGFKIIKSDVGTECNPATATAEEKKLIVYSCCSLNWAIAQFKGCDESCHTDK